MLKFCSAELASVFLQAGLLSSFWDRLLLLLILLKGNVPAQFWASRPRDRLNGHLTKGHLTKGHLTKQAIFSYRRGLFRDPICTHNLICPTCKSDIQVLVPIRLDGVLVKVLADHPMNNGQASSKTHSWQLLDLKSQQMAAGPQKK